MSKKISKPQPKRTEQDTPRNETAPADATFVKRDGGNELRKYQKRKIQNNWEKYDTLIVSNEEESTSEKTDFLFVANNASSDIAYFQLASEKEWGKSEHKGSKSTLQLDLNLLSNGLATIPFYDRIGIETNRLGHSDVERCNYHAVQSQKYYTKIVDSIKRTSETLPKASVSNTEKDNIVNLSNLTLSDSAVNLTLEMDRTAVAVESDFLESLQNENLAANAEPNSKTYPGSEDQDLEDWLDGVLDS